VIKYDYIWSDPFLLIYRALNVTDEESSPEAINALFEQVQNSPDREHPAYVNNLGVQSALNAVKAKVLQGDSMLKKRFVRFSQNLPVTEMPVGWQHGAEAYHLAVLALELAQNEGRCGDGLSDYIHEHERTFLKLMASEAIGSSMLTSFQIMEEKLARIFMEYREDYVQKYFSYLGESVEGYTEGRELLRARMRLPLGLMGAFSALWYPGLGQGEREIFQPRSIMQRFLKGGRLPGDGERRDILPYDAKLLISLAKDALWKDGQFLYEHFVQYQSDIAAKYKMAFSMLEDNEYVRPNVIPQEESIFTDRLFEELLLFYGYLRRK